MPYFCVLLTSHLSHPPISLSHTEASMAVSSSAASLLALTAVVVTVFSLIGASLAADAPAPAPTSSVGSLSPSLAAGFAVAAVSLLFGSALRIWTFLRWSPFSVVRLVIRSFFGVYIDDICSVCMYRPPVCVLVVVF